VQNARDALLAMRCCGARAPRARPRVCASRHTVHPLILFSVMQLLAVVDLIPFFFSARRVDQ
jgi:hypothetical protein